MSHITVMNRSEVFAAAAAICAAGFLAVPVTARADPTCTDYGVGAGGDFGLTQSNGWGMSFFMADVTGRSFNGDNASAASSSGGGAMKGTVSGGIQGRHLDFTVHWTGGSVGHYTGDVGDDGFAHGRTVDDAHRDSTANWDSTRPLICITPAASAPAPAPAPQQPAPAAQKTATVIADVDVFNIAHGDDPDQNGVVGVKIGMLRAGQQVGLAGPCQPNDWCHILASGLPGGNGFVWGNLQF